MAHGRKFFPYYSGGIDGNWNEQRKLSLQLFEITNCASPTSNGQILMQLVEFYNKYNSDTHGSELDLKIVHSVETCIDSTNIKVSVTLNGRQGYIFGVLFYYSDLGDTA